MIADLQAAEALISNKHLSLGFDATTQEGVHLNHIHFTTITVLGQQSFSSASKQTAAQRLTRTLAVLAASVQDDARKGHEPEEPPELKGVHVGKEMDTSCQEKMVNMFQVAYFVIQKGKPICSNCV